MHCRWNFVLPSGMNTQAYALRKACRDKQYVPTVTQAYKLARLARSNVIIRKHEPSVVSSFKNLKTSRKKVQPFCSWVRYARPISTLPQTTEGSAAQCFSPIFYICRGMTLKEAIMQTTFHKRKVGDLPLHNFCTHSCNSASVVHRETSPSKALSSALPGLGGTFVVCFAEKSRAQRSRSFANGSRSAHCEYVSANAHEAPK